MVQLLRRLKLLIKPRQKTQAEIIAELLALCTGLSRDVGINVMIVAWPSPLSNDRDAIVRFSAQVDIKNTVIGIKAIDALEDCLQEGIMAAAQEAEVEE